MTALTNAQKLDAMVTGGANTAGGQAKTRSDKGIRESIEDALADKLASLGLIDDAERAKSTASWAGLVADFLPIVGDIGGAVDTVDSFKAGNYGDAAINAGLTAIGLIPGVGDAIASSGRNMMKMAGDKLQKTPTADTSRYNLSGQKQSDAAYKKMMQTRIAQLRKEMGMGGDMDTIVRNTYDIKELPTVTASDLRGGVIVPIKGDPTNVGMLEQAQGLKLDNPVELQGGPLYPVHSKNTRSDPAAWESTDRIANTFQSKVKGVADYADTDNVWGLYSPMKLESANFSTMPAEVALEEMQTLIKAGGKYPKEMVDDINDAVRSSGKEFSDFPGIESPEARAYLAVPGRQKARKAMTDKMKLAKYRDAGFPNIHQIYRDVATPGLLNREYGEVGDLLVKLNPGGSTDTLSSHRSYGTRIPIHESQKVARMNDTRPFYEIYRENDKVLRDTPDKNGDLMADYLRVNTIADSKATGDGKSQGFEAVTDGLLEMLLNNGLINE